MAKDMWLIWILLVFLSICCFCGCATKEAPSTGTINVSSSPQGAEVYLDNQYKGTTPVTIPNVPEGDHAIELRLNGYNTWRNSGSVSEGDLINIFVTLERISAPTTLPTLEVQPVDEWIWSRDGWGDWQHSASWSGTPYRGPASSAHGPVIVVDHGEYGTDTYLSDPLAQISTQELSKPFTQASISKTFTDRSGSGWDTLIFDFAGENISWMTIEVNGQAVFNAIAQTHLLTVNFPRTTNATVKISYGNRYAAGYDLEVYLKCYSLKLSYSGRIEIAIETTKPVG